MYFVFYEACSFKTRHARDHKSDMWRLAKRRTGLEMASVQLTKKVLDGRRWPARGQSGLARLVAAQTTPQSSHLVIGVRRGEAHLVIGVRRGEAHLVIGVRRGKAHLVIGVRQGEAHLVIGVRRGEAHLVIGVRRGEAHPVIGVRRGEAHLVVGVRRGEDDGGDAHQLEHGAGVQTVTKHLVK